MIFFFLRLYLLKYVFNNLVLLNILKLSMKFLLYLKNLSLYTLAIKLIVHKILFRSFLQFFISQLNLYA